MKKKIIDLVGCTLLCSILVVNMLMTPDISFAAKKSVPKGIEYLDDVTNKYDLNGDNKVDVIKIKITQKNGADATLKLYINNKLCLNWKNKYNKKGFGSFGVQVCDLDKNDNYLDLYIHLGHDAFTDASFFARYNGKSLDSKVVFETDSIHKIFASGYKIKKVIGNGKFYISNWSYCDAIGNFVCIVPFQLKDDSVKVISKTYKFDNSSGKYKYKAAKSFPAYRKAGSKKVAYTVKEGDKVTFDTLYIPGSGKAYLRMTDTKGRTGWIDSDQKNLFSNIPLAD